MSTVKNYLSLIKFSHTIFAMPFALIGFFLAFFYDKYTYAGFPGWHSTIFVNDGLYKEIGLDRHDSDLYSIVWWKEPLIRLVLIILCMVFARSAAMAFNRYLDRDIDALNPRTAIREVPKGIITPKNALVFTIVNCGLFILCTFFINTICFLLSPVALAVVLGY